MEKNNRLLVNARQLRREMTPQERRLWYCFLRTYPIKFFKQRIIDNYIVDFYSSVAKLVIEIDGSQHYEPEEIEYDRKRTKCLEKYGLLVVRYSNRDINEHFRNVCESIHLVVSKRIGYDPYSVDDGNNG